MSFQLPLFLPFFPPAFARSPPSPQSPLPVIHGHLLPASDFPSSSSVHHCPPLSQPPFPAATALRVELLLGAAILPFQVPRWEIQEVAGNGVLSITKPLLEGT